MEVACDGPNVATDEQETAATPAEDEQLDMPDADPHTGSEPQACTAVLSIQYSELPLESKEKLEYFLRLWCRWHQGQYKQGVPQDGLIAEGRFDLDLSIEGAVWTDKPGLVRGKAGTAQFNLAYEQDSNVPVYDREAGFSLNDLNNGSAAKRSRTDSRCFNCGSYAHSLPECWKPICNTTVAANRKEFLDAKSLSSALFSKKRYFESAARKGIVPGQLSKALRAAVGVSLSEPPPWLSRMIALGLPPSYANDALEDNTSEDAEEEIRIFDDTGGLGDDVQDEAVVKLGKDQDESAQQDLDNKACLPQFAGLNAEVPKGPDSARWNAALARGRALKAAIEKPGHYHTSLQRSLSSPSGGEGSVPHGPTTSSMRAPISLFASPPAATQRHSAPITLATPNSHSTPATLTPPNAHSTHTTHNGAHHTYSPHNTHSAHGAHITHSAPIMHYSNHTPNAYTVVESALPPGYSDPYSQAAGVNQSNYNWQLTAPPQSTGGNSAGQKRRAPYYSS